MSFMELKYLSREALETTYRLIRLRLFKADAKNDYAVLKLKEAIEEADEKIKHEKLVDLFSKLTDPKIDLSNMPT